MVTKEHEDDRFCHRVVPNRIRSQRLIHPVTDQ